MSAGLCMCGTDPGEAEGGGGGGADLPAGSGGPWTPTLDWRNFIVHVMQSVVTPS